MNYSLEMKPKQTVYVWSQANAAPLMLECYREILKAGGNAFLRADLPGAQEIFYQVAHDGTTRFCLASRSNDRWTKESSMRIFALGPR